METLAVTSEIMVENSTNSTRCSPYADPAYANVAIASAASAVISLAASCFVIFIIILFKKWRFFTQRLILYLAIASLMTSFSTILHRVDYKNQTTSFYEHFCIFGGFFEQMTSWMLLNSISVITVYLFALAVLKKDTKKLEILYVLLIFVFPILINWIPFIHSSYGRAGAWCWIRIEEREDCTDFKLGQYFIFALWFIPLYVILIALIVMYVIIIINLNQSSCTKKKSWGNDNTAETKHLQKANRRNTISLITYPLLYFILEIFPLINRIQNTIYHNQPNLVFWYMSALAFPLAGGLIGIAYALDPETWKRLTWAHIRAAFRRWTKEEKLAEYPMEYVKGDDQGTLRSNYKGSTLPTLSVPSENTTL